MSKLRLQDMPLLRPHPDGGWVVERDWNMLGHTVPAGFRTDLDSIPRLPYVYAAFKGRFRAAPLLHDYLYGSQALRAYADKMFRRLMFLEANGRWLERQLIIEPIYYGVRLLGWLRYTKK